MAKSITDILESEPIRLIDGRWSDGFADTKALQMVIDSGYAEVYEIAGGWKFVRKAINLSGGGGVDGKASVSGGAS